MDRKKTKKTIPDTICRVHRSGGYAVLSNCFVRSTNIGCDSIGLLGKINDLPPTWNFTIKIKTFAEANQIIDDYIYFYNHQRIQLKTKLTPLELRSQFVA